MRNTFYALLLSALGGSLCQTAVAAPAVSCSQIENARERLACFDQQFPRDEGAPSLPRITSEPIRTPDRLGQDTPVLEGEYDQPRYRSRTDAPPSPGRPGGIFDQTEELDMTSTIAALRRGDQQRMIYRLENGQIWMQNSPRDLPFKIGDEIRIKNGRIGGYIMSSERGVTTRVRRVQ